MTNASENAALTGNAETSEAAGAPGEREARDESRGRARRRWRSASRSRRAGWKLERHRQATAGSSRV